MTLNLNANSSLARGKALPWKLSAMLNHQLLNEQISSSKATGEFSHSAPLHLHHAVLQRLPSRMQLVSPSCEIATFLLQSLMQLYVASALQVSHLHFAAAGTGFQIFSRIVWSGEHRITGTGSVHVLHDLLHGRRIRSGRQHHPLLAFGAKIHPDWRRTSSNFKQQGCDIYKALVFMLMGIL